MTADDAPSFDGLTEAEVADRRSRGLTNDVPVVTSRSYAEIVRANVFTRFNALLGVLLVAIVLVREFRDALFGIVLVLNALIGIVQEVRAKNTLDRLTLLSAPMATVKRGGSTATLPIGDLVLDDVIELAPGDQIAVDGDVVVHSGLELDESLLTGEADPIVKTAGDEVLSGSFVVAGSGVYRATKVGVNTYAHRLREEASRFTLVKSELRDGINAILKVVTWLLIPTAVLLTVTQFRNNNDITKAVQSSVAGLVAMVPEGLVLLTSAALAIGVLRLGRKQVLTQELAAIEGLARVDTLCVDKTGTLTEGKLVLASIEPFEGHTSGSCSDVLAAMGAADSVPNGSMQAVIDAHPMPPEDAGWEAVDAVPFSSTRKWSANSFATRGSWVLGAPDVLAANVPSVVAPAVAERVHSFAATGRRVLLLGQAPGGLTSEVLATDLAPVCLVVFEERIRDDAPETIAYFLRQGVAVKVISGDNAVTVGAVAARCGIPGADAPIDARDLPDDLPALAEAMDAHSVFGRVTPHQKRAMVQALQSRGHEVAMTGDGVNDTLALKDAEIGIAMGSGSPAARAVARFVLLDNSFAVFPSVMAEGRRVIANVERVANLFVTKTIYAMVLAVVVGISGGVYPFLPRHMTIISTLTIGVPAFVLALAPNSRRARPGFLQRVLRFTIPAGFVAGTATLTAFTIVKNRPGVAIEQARSAALVVLFVVAMWVLSILARPLVAWRVALLATMVVGFVCVFASPPLTRYFDVALPPDHAVAVIVSIAVVSCAALEGMWHASGLADRRWGIGEVVAGWGTGD